MERRKIGFFEPHPRGGAIVLILSAMLAAAVGGTQASDHAAAPVGKHAAASTTTAPDLSSGEAASAAPRAEPTGWGLTSSEALWADLLEGNHRFMSGRPFPREYILTRSHLVEGQQPPVMVLACADSRVSPELVFDKNLGDLFVVRTAGNIADAIVLGSLEYAAEHLHTRLLIVLGHEKCGAVAAACSGQPLPSPNLQALVERIAPALSRSVALNQHKPITISDVETNAEASAEYILRNSPILAAAVREGHLSVIPAIYHLDSGEVTRVDGDFTWMDTPEH